MAARIKKFYVYRFDDVIGPVYVGKGSNRRFANQRRRFPAFGRIVKWFASESDALSFEKKLISEIFPRLNKCAGGNGSRCKSTRAIRFREIEDIGTRVYAARLLLRVMSVRPELIDLSKVDLFRRVAFDG